MNTMKQALWLVKFEMKASVKQYFFLLGFAIFYGIFFSMTISLHNTLLFDFFFILVFGFCAVWARPKELQLQKISEGLWASPFVVMLNQLPIPKNVLINSRFIVFYIFSIPFNLFILTFIYIFSMELRESIPAISYLIFSVIWICFGIAFGSMFPASDVGDKMPKNKWKWVAIGVLFYGGLIGSVIAVNMYSGQGIVGWSIHAAKEFPVVSILLSLMIAILSVIYYMRYMYKKIAQIDYLK